jgi:hypothetical protein
MSSADDIDTLIPEDGLDALPAWNAAKIDTRVKRSEHNG